MFTLLSYSLGPHTPTYRDNPPVEVQWLSQTAHGDEANWLSFTTINHNGTHLDAPYHFNPHGRRITDLDLDEFVFRRPLLLDLPKQDGELISENDLSVHAGEIALADLLLIRTGWATLYRESDPQRFGRQAPGFAVSAGHYLGGFADLRALGMDLPSAASPIMGNAHQEGLEFHRIVLGQQAGDPYLLLIEDMRLEHAVARALGRVLVVPLLLDGADAAPVTVLSEV
ncbi:cyclase family protein [Deinococcus sp.]|uniref:cyclase family protein n=1 Tax=Deinococcus sp. TaxID=47478 RepID=UPI003CC674C5